jgi:glutamine amidotransferase
MLEPVQVAAGDEPDPAAPSPRRLKVPHMGWNEVAWTADHPYVRDVPETWFYFVHSYAPSSAIPGVVGQTRYGSPFAAAIARGNVFATQFHPEKSGEPGLGLYRAFVRAVDA